MRIDQAALYASRALDIIPVIGNVKNLAEFFFKHVHIKKMDEGKIANNHYYTHIKERSSALMLALMIPIVNVGVAIYYYFSSQQTAQESSQAQGENKSSSEKKVAQDKEQTISGSSTANPYRKELIVEYTRAEDGKTISLDLQPIQTKLKETFPESPHTKKILSIIKETIIHQEAKDLSIESPLCEDFEFMLELGVAASEVTTPEDTGSILDLFLSKIPGTLNNKEFFDALRAACVNWKNHCCAWGELTENPEFLSRAPNTVKRDRLFLTGLLRFAQNKKLEIDELLRSIFTHCFPLDKNLQEEDVLLLRALFSAVNPCTGMERPTDLFFTTFPSLQSNRDFLKKLVSLHIKLFRFQYLSEELRQDRSFLKELISLNHSIYYFLPREKREKNHEIALFALEKGCKIAGVFQKVSPDESFILNALKLFENDREKLATVHKFIPSKFLKNGEFLRKATEIAPQLPLRDSEKKLLAKPEISLSKTS